ncbi:adrenodoxin-like [Lingula anatina]|uniref:Adrenodoxin-like n=1 Tax=Lingula anatina TaxID=7574 RepID=A0A1S3HCB3_LINAN|nr:adrenodoxin-like [Lingula anatina]|eukprot:XP_013383640.1 adrenodoxin-like [Lingula anatina]
MFRRSARILGVLSRAPFDTVGAPCKQAIRTVSRRHTDTILRQFSVSTVVLQNWKKKETVTIHFVLQDGTKESVQANIGDNLLDVVLDNDVDIDGFGACEGTLACSTCHLIFKKEDYDQLPEEPTDEELDMLDLAYGLTDTSRLGCQVIVTKDMDGLEVSVPSGVADARS